MNTPIDVPRMFELLLQACPGVEDDWNEHVRAYAEEGPYNYLGIAVFARYVVTCARAGEIERARPAFDLLELFFTQGTQEVRNLSTVGFLEDVQNIASWEPFGSQVFLPLLKPSTRQAWDEIRRMWEGKSSLAEVIRSEVKAFKKGQR